MASRKGDFFLTKIANEQWGPGLNVEVVGSYILTEREQVLCLPPKTVVEYRRLRRHFVRELKRRAQENRN